MFKRSTAIAITIGTLAFAADTDKAFDASCDKVWDAAKAVIAKHYKAGAMAEHDHMGSFEIGNGIVTARRALNFSLKGEGDKCTVTISGHFSGFLNNDKGDFFKRVQAELGK